MMMGFDIAKAWLAPYLAYIRLGAVVLAAIFIAAAVVRVHQWHEGFLRVQATEKALATSEAKLGRCTADAEIAQQAAAEQAAHAESVAAKDRDAAQRVERELQTNLSSSDARARDLARRLHGYQARRCGNQVPATAALAGAVSPGGEPGGAGEAERLAAAIRDAETDVLAKCGRDGTTLSAVAPWYDELVRNRAGNAP